MQRYLRIILSWIICILPLMAYAANSNLTNIRVIKIDNATRLMFSLTQPVSPRVFTLQNPNRLVIDLTQTQLTEHLKNLNFPTSEIKAIRSGHPKPGVLRLVLDLNGAVQYKLDPDSNSDHFTLDISNVQPVSMPPPAAPTPLSKATPSSTASSPTAQLTIPTPAVAPKPVPKKIAVQAHHVTVVVIDAGHGGKDPGASGPDGTQEKEVVLAIAKQLADLINRQPNMRAVLTRNGDYFVPLRDRLRLARKGKADIFMSIHADSYFDKNADGASVFALSQRGATSEAARWLAKRENTSELGGVDLAELEDKSYLLRSVLIDLAQTATTTGSLRLGSAMLDSLDNITGLHYTRVEQAPFVVLKSPDIPSVLVEIGFISNSKEEKRLRDKKYQAQLAQALFSGVHNYLKKYSYSG